jgi:hypothetical protein
MGFIIDISPYRWESILDCMASSIRWIPIVRMDHFSPLSDESIMSREEEFWMLQPPLPLADRGPKTRRAPQYWPHFPMASRGDCSECPRAFSEFT